MTLLDKNQQQGVSEQRGMPVEVVADSQRVVSIAAEALTFQYYNAGTLTTDAGQAAGTVVVIKLANGGVLNAVGDVIGSFNDTSFAFVTGTILTTQVAFPYLKAEEHDRNTGTLKAQAITNGFTNGQWCLDHRNGIIYGVKATTGSSDTANYKIAVQQAGSGGGVASEIDVVKWGGTATTLGQKTSAASVPVVFPSDQSLGAAFLQPTHWTPADGAATYTSSTSITCSGFPFTVDDANCTVVAIYYKPTGGNWQTVLVNGNGGVSMVAASNVITVAGAGTPFAASDTYLVGVNYQSKTYDAPNDADAVEVINPDPTQRTDMITLLSAVTADTTAIINVRGYKSVKFIAVGSDTALLHDSIDLKESYDNGTTFVDLPGQAVSITRNRSYVWHANVASATHIQVNFDEIVATAGTVSLYYALSYEDAPTPQLPPYKGTFRESLVLTTSYVTTNELFIEGFKNLSVIQEFTTGATGAVDTWLPYYQIEVSRTRTGDNWEYINAQSVAAGVVTNTRAEFVPNAGANYTAASTTYKDVITTIEDNPGWVRMRVSVKESNSGTPPTNHGLSVIELTAK